ncbi:putative centromere protein X [Scophthalmus maximus]|uniref:Centromere protein X n=1 Tax=Scophthalmus maximus TaxID=52904 RepID=A0A2U9CS22_SCOMX|nr:putative centromere protein X [Scophthalmus maximus]
MAEQDAEIGFRKDTVSKLLSGSFKEEKTKLSGDAALLMAEMLKVFVQEAAVRSLKQAESEDSDQVDIEHFEKVLPQLKAAVLPSLLHATSSKAHLCSSVEQQVLPACSMVPFIKASWSSWKQLE